MDRRNSIKTLFVGSVATGMLLEACRDGAENPAAAAGIGDILSDRMPEELQHEKRLQAERFFTEVEMAAIAILADIIIPADEVSGSATEAVVPEFIEYIVKDRPEHQVPMRGGLRWLDLHCIKLYERAFADCSAEQRISVVEQVAYPSKAAPELRPGVQFFSLMRNLTISGFYTTKMGLEDIGYVGNRPNQWNGVPEDEQQRLNVFYSEKELKECISFEGTAESGLPEAAPIRGISV